MAEQEREVKLALHWLDSSSLPTLYASQVYVSHAGGEFYVIFGEVQQPIWVNLTRAEIEEKGRVAVRPVAKLVLTYENMKRFVEVVAANLATYEKRRERLAKGEE